LVSSLASRKGVEASATVSSSALSYFGNVHFDASPIV